MSTMGTQGTTVVLGTLDTYDTIGTMGTRGTKITNYVSTILNGETTKYAPNNQLEIHLTGSVLHLEL